MKKNANIIKCDLCGDTKEIPTLDSKRNDYCELTFDNIVKQICLQCCIEIGKKAIVQGVLKID